jgi:uncharacterized protein (TIGR00730 family)
MMTKASDINDPKPFRSKPLVSVFGSAGPIAGSEEYIQALNLGTALGEKGFDVLTGGYAGVMEAVSKGASEAGAHVFGATCDAIVRFRPGIEANPWVREEMRTDTLLERLGLVTSKCDAVIVLPGGVGTLVELALVWNSTMIGELTPIPIFTVGEPWRGVMEALRNPAFISPAHFGMVEWVSCADQAISRLQVLLPQSTS